MANLKMLCRGAGAAMTLVASLCAGTALAQAPSDELAATLIHLREEGLANDHSYEMLRSPTTEVGPR